MNEDERAGRGRGRVEHRADALVVERVAVHRRKQADAAQAPGEGALQMLGGVFRGGVEHEIAVEAAGRVHQRRRYRLLVAMNAGDDGCALHAVPVQFPYPALGERARVFRRYFPAEQRAEVRQRLAALNGQ